MTHPSRAATELRLRLSGGFGAYAGEALDMKGYIGD
jgi:hypothetical protein